jgi:hypothetical protein
MFRQIPFLVCLLCLLPSAWAVGAPPASTPPPAEKPADEVRREVVQLIKDLDSERFYTRTDAAKRLEQLASQAAFKGLVATEFSRVLVAAETSLEVRKQVELLQRTIPDVQPAPPGEIGAAELARLIGQLEDDSYGVRLSATRRLEWFLGNPKSVCRILVRLKDRMADDRLSADTPIWLERMYDRARAAWLLTDPTGWELPQVSTDQIKRWLDDVVRVVPADAPSNVRHAARTAKRELWDLLARDEYVPQLKRLLEVRLADGELNRDGMARLRELLDLTRPAMVAEYWEGHHHMGTQQLLVNVPARTEGSLRPSHFDWINDETAHCVSGSNLAPGEYPVGVAIPHPNREGAIFHLVNLPTPRRRMAYDQYAKLEEAKRLTELSRRTLDRFLRLKQPLVRDQLLLLSQLDFREVSRFAGGFFMAVDDQTMAPEELPFVNQYLPGSVRLNSVMQRLGGRSSRHGVLAAILVAEGTKEAAPGLLEAIAARRFLSPSSEPPRRMEWTAALAIAQRDPWPEVDRWLGGLIDQTVPLVEQTPNAADLGATAAGLLLKRHQQDPARFGLEPVNDDLLSESGLTGYRFPSDDARKKTAAWWGEKKK